MLVETGCYDLNPRTEAEVAAAVAEDGFSQTVPNCTHNTHNGLEENLRLAMEEISYHQYQHNHHDQNHNQPPIHEDAAAAVAAATAMEIELQQQLAFHMDHSYNTSDHKNNHSLDNSYIAHEMQEIDHFNHHHSHQDQQLQQIDIHNGHQNFDYSSLQNSPYPPAPDLLNLFHLPRYSASPLLTSSSISFSDPSQNTTNYQNAHGLLGDVPTAADSASSASVLYNPVFHLNLPPQPPLIRELFESLPNGYMPGSRNGSLFGPGGDEREGSGSVTYQDGDVRQFENGVLEFTRDMACIAKGRDGETKHFATERHRRQQLNDKYQALRSLVPNPTKIDRASVVGDAIEYIKELIRTVNELKLLVDKKRCGRERSKRHKTEADDAVGDVESCNTKPLCDTDHSYNIGSLRSSWLQRKSKDTEVDVRIIEDEVTIKLVQRKNNCLLFVSKVLDELQLDLHHVAGGHIGDFFSFLFNTKWPFVDDFCLIPQIFEGSSVYASSIANKLIDVLDRQCAAVPPSNY
ncbi:Transcription factor bHLH10 [Morella rubra]|nr:Transcription factor bHLH10 [Morella rubra]KAB1221405.1 Transcription factor bHLH10 [Morella rubra]